MGLILSNYRLGGSNEDPNRGTLWPNAYCRFREGRQHFRNTGGFGATLNVEVWPSIADAKSNDPTKAPLSAQEEVIEISDQADMIAMLTGDFGDWEPPVDKNGKPIGGLQLMAAFAVRDMPRWQGTWE